MTNVTALLNTTTDPEGRNIPMARGYAAGDTLVHAITYTTDTTGDAALEEAFHLLNVGDDPAFGTPDPRAVKYRSNGHRSLSVGDVVIIDGSAHAVAELGFTPIATPVYATPDLLSAAREYVHATHGYSNDDEHEAARELIDALVATLPRAVADQVTAAFEQAESGDEDYDNDDDE